jgi:hypothetical protein
MGGDIYRRFYAAPVQAAPVFLDRDASISKLEQWVAKAKVAGATSSGSTSGLFTNPVTVALSGTVNNWTPVGWVPGITNALNITPIGTPTVNGINPVGIGSGFSFVVHSTSTTRSINFDISRAGVDRSIRLLVLKLKPSLWGPQTGTIMTFNGTNLIFGR